ncbi:MAG: hypothetical protein IPM42_15330 [Saprospiraceae bacterium]|nr:hypothetical protein [Saprospiraceae bacterium]
MSYQWKFELQSVLFIVLVVFLFCFPIWLSLQAGYPFYLENIITIIIFLSFAKYIFLLKYTPYSRMKWVKFAFVFLCIPIFLYLIDSLFDFQRFLDEEGIASLFVDTQDMSNYNFGRFIRYQFIFFNVGALVTTVLLPFRLIISFWRVRNTVDRV